MEDRYYYIIERIYVFSVVLAMGLLFYANSDNIESPQGMVVSLGIGKAFYLPCGMALLLSFFIHSVDDKFENTVNALVVVALLSSLIHPPYGDNVLSWGLTRFIMGILCFRKLHVVNPEIVVKYFLWAAPVIILPHYILTNPFSYGPYRYGGFYGDPNFLALALNFLIAVCYMGIVRTDKKVEIIIGCISIVAAIPLIFVGVSRSGILGLVLIMFVIMMNLRKNNRKIYIILLILIIATSGTMMAKFSDTFDFVEARFSNDSESDKTSSEARIKGIEGCLTVLYNNPELIPLGIGVGNTVATISEYKLYGYKSGDLHSTFFSILYEMGIFGLVFYSLLYWYSYINLKYTRNYLLMALLFSSVLSLFTLPGSAFMPAWILLFFVSNIYLENDSADLYNAQFEEMTDDDYDIIEIQ